MFSTLSTNFTGSLETGVDPRNGQFFINLPLVQVSGNQLTGPNISLSARYSSLSDLNSNGLGKGFSLGGVSSFNRITRRLTLSNGESWPVDTCNSIPDRRLKDCVFLKTFSNNNIEEYRLSWKNGVTEYLSLVGGNIFATSRIISPIGKEIKLKWSWNGTSVLLNAVTDLQSDLCRFEYDAGNIILTIWPKTVEECRLIFAIQNFQLHSIRRMVSESEWLEWKLNYSIAGPSGQQRINSLTCPTGMSYTVNYSKQKGLYFPSASGLQWLPVVESYTQNYGANQPPKSSRYTYTSNNFLGHNASSDVFGSWSMQSDYIYAVLTKEYTYGSTETIATENDNVSIIRTYNNYHFLISEETVRNGCSVLEEMQYYAETGTISKNQPCQYMLANKKIVTFKDNNHNKRSEDTITLFDDYGNPTYIKSVDGTVTRYEYYAADFNINCPAEPNGFVRFLKQKTVEPRITSFSDTPQHITRYTYSTLGSTNYVVQKTVSEYRGVLSIKLLTQRTITYDEDINSSMFGCITATVDEKFVHGENSPKFITQQIFSTSISNGVLTQQVTFRGYDGLSTTSTRQRSVYSGILHSETSTQGVETQYVYDAIGRVTRRTLSPKSEYENTTIWQYIIEPDGPCTIESDELGNKNKAHFDGTGRIVRRSTFDADTSKWYVTFSCNHNHLGEVSKGIVTDCVAGDTDIFSLSSDIIFGGWGEKKKVVYSDGRVVEQEIDPINLTHTVYSYGGSNKNVVRSGSVTTILDKISQLPVRKELRDNTGTLESVRHYSWDGLGQMREEQDELGAITKRAYDEYGRVITQVMPDGTIINRTFAPHLTGNQITYISVTGLDAIENSRTWMIGSQSFDSLGRLTKCINGGRETTYTYADSVPVPSTITYPSGKTVAYTYIPALGNAVSSKTIDSITQTFKYIGKTGKLLSASGENTKIENTWTANGLKEEAFSRNNQTRRAKYTRTLNGIPITYTDISGKKTGYTMNDHGQIVSIYDDALTVHLTYDVLGHLKTQTVKDNASASSLNIDLNLDNFGREIKRTITNSQGIKVMLSQTWQKNGLLSTRTIHKNNIKVLDEKYGYDRRNRLVTFNSSGSSLPVDPYGHKITGQTYSYDALNNFTIINTTLSDCTTNTATYIYGNDDDPTQLTSITNTHASYPKSISLVYDSNGRMIRDESGRTLTYDAMGRLVSIDANNGSTTGAYSYDALNRLISQKVGKNYVYEMYYRDEELVNEVVPSQNRETRLIKSGHTCLGISDESNLTLTAGDIHDSMMWSEDVGTSKEGQLYVWSPYGSGNPGNRLPGFNGERIDPVSGAYHLGNGYRAYNSVLMRFTCPDSLSPFGIGGINPYAYCSGDPINRTDPSGHLSSGAIFGIVWGSIGLLGALFTGGMAIAAAGGIMAAISSTSASSLILGGVAVASQATGIVADSLEDVAPEASSILGWISMGTGVPGMVLHVGNFGHGLREGILTALDTTFDTVDVARNFVHYDVSIRTPKRIIGKPRIHERFEQVAWDKTRDLFVKKFMVSQKITSKFISDEHHPKQFIDGIFNGKDKRVEKLNIRNNLTSDINSKNNNNQLYDDSRNEVKYGSSFRLIDHALIEHLNLPSVTPY